MNEATKTLKATLVSPTTGKERGLQRTVANYRRALRDAFDAHADTMSVVNDIVTPFDLPYQAKDALKSYVPKLRRTYNARELADDHPVRFVNRAAKFDHSADRDAEFVWNVPQPGRGTNFWIPLHVNPDQRDVWFDLLNGDAEPGELRLLEGRDSWVLHVTVEHEVPEPNDSDEPTYVGFDIGESKLLAGCACRDDGTPVRPMFVDGGRARHLRKEMHTTLKRLQERDAAKWRTDERFEHYQNALTDIVEKASRQAVEYAASFENPVIALEDLSYIRERLDYGAYMNRRLHSWAFARLQGRITDKAHEAGIRVEFVAPAYTSQTCHACGHIGRRSEQAEFRCTNADCWVSEYQADLNAAANIAGRVDPWGESLPWKPAGDDSPQDRSTRDSATARREPSAKPAQMTLAEWGRNLSRTTGHPLCGSPVVDGFAVCSWSLRRHGVHGGRGCHPEWCDEHLDLTRSRDGWGRTVPGETSKETRNEAWATISQFDPDSGRLTILEALSPDSARTVRELKADPDLALADGTIDRYVRELADEHSLVAIDGRPSSNNVTLTETGAAATALLGPDGRPHHPE